MSLATAQTIDATAPVAPDTSVAAAPRPEAPPVPKPVKRPYLYHVELVRSITFALVMFVHVYTSTTAEWTSVGTNATALLFHATRNVFFALTGFVLMYQYLDRPEFTPTSFWRKRIKLVIIPYAAWSVLYWLIVVMWGGGRIGDVGSELHDLRSRLLTGTAAYHLYFLFVMLQVYLLFPALRKLVTRTRGHHGLLLTGALAVQVTIICLMSYWHAPTAIGEQWSHLYATFLPYTLMIVLGALAADHREQVNEWCRGRGELLLWLLLGTGILAVGSYLHRVLVGGAPVNDPLSAFQPTLLPFIVVAAVSVYAISLHWATLHRRFQPTFASAVSYASNRSFPVFLVHVMVLFFLLRIPSDSDQGWFLTRLPQPFATVTVYLLTLALSLAAVEMLRRLPGSLYLTGRPRLPLRPMI